MFEKLLDAFEVYQDNGMFEEHDYLVRMAIHSYKEKGDFIKATYLYRYVIKARACYLLVAQMRRKERYRKSKTNQLLKLLKRSEYLLRNYDLPENWAELYLSYGCLWMDYMSNLPLDKRKVVREIVMECFRTAIYYSNQDHRGRVRMKMQSQVHLMVAMIHLGYCSTFSLAQENHIPPNDIKEAENHLRIIQCNFGDIITRATRILLMKTQSDLFYHKGQYQRAKDKAEDAFECASRLGFNTVLNTLQERIDFCQKKLETVCDQILSGNLL